VCFPANKQQQKATDNNSANAPKLSFNFSIPQKSAKQASLPPQQSGRRSRTPVASTPRGANGSAQRSRSASAPRSSARGRNTPGQATPQLGKRKRGDKNATSGDDDDGELDPLSPENDTEVRSVEKSRKVAVPVSPIREELEEADELSMLGDNNGSARKVEKDASEPSEETPAPAATRTRRSLPQSVERTPVTDRNGSLAAASRPLKAKSQEPPPTTPAIVVGRRNVERSASSTRSRHALTTSNTIEDAFESDDELATPQSDSVTQHSVSRAQLSQPIQEEEQEMDIDELSPMQVVTTAASTSKVISNSQSISNRTQPKDQQATPKLTNRRKPSQVLEEDEDLIQTTPAPSKSRRIRGKSADVEQVDDDDEADEISPESSRLRRSPAKPAFSTSSAIKKLPNAMSSDRPAERELEEEEEEDEEEEVEEVEEEEREQEEEEEEEPTPRPAPAPKRTQARSSPKHKQRPKAFDKPSRKRQKLGGPIQSIQVMRLKGSKVKGYTVADTTRTAIEEYIDERVAMLSSRFQGTQDLARRKQIKTRINLQLSFKEALSERMLDLQDVNDSLTSRAHKLKLFKRHNAELRKEILATQNSRYELAIEYDNVLAEFEAEKEAFESRNRLSTAMFDIQMAIRRGKEKQEELGRVDDGPEIPISMFLETCGRDIGSVGGGLLDKLSTFNGVLERAAGFLEGRA
jgi:hypothetical protein